ncbi:MAG TPA: TetR/AcrR family transcriptional regulator [Syntrophomonadaceae bacterium]|nr:TetR/AcrR family transcriptional regulator [Syntrophomonadaceae bacterium]HPR93879.1 TetR/AcrR family transcriptional regulator [Syntrophomonadaceae bacterium]
MATNSKSGKRQVIIEAGLKVFSQKGFHDARMEEIAAAAGIGKGTIYEYFSSKSHLFQEIMSVSVNSYYENLAAKDLNALPFRERIQFLLAGHLRFYIENKDLTRLIFWDVEIMDEELKEWGNKLRKEKQLLLIEIIKQGIADGEIRELDPQLLSLLIMGSFASFWLPIAVDAELIDPEATAQQITDIIFNGIKP